MVVSLRGFIERRLLDRYFIFPPPLSRVCCLLAKRDILFFSKPPLRAFVKLGGWGQGHAHPSLARCSVQARAIVDEVGAPAGEGERWISSLVGALAFAVRCWCKD